ncbi:hypothetical protein ANACOL_01732 [Anaerotruncus colihominis DSM 17241]|uniref:Uncharacterized protein n=1 Tax=Anaerotruncus colihominis DSM 17241 TaxID=445972 RepID=B0PAD5_9FIRM|nr:hypothetical protein ANACOL_01732 [Anaerotruncus colihominis DSM 17241]
MTFILSPYGQGDARARSAAALMADFIMPRCKGGARISHIK